MGRNRLGESAGRESAHRGGEPEALEDRLARAETLLAESQALGGIGSWAHDVATATSWWSDEQFRLLGFEPGSIEPGFPSFLLRLHPDDRAVAAAARERATTLGEPYDLRCRVQLPDGSERVLQARATVVFDEHGNPSRLNGTTLDITDHERSRAALEASTAALAHQAMHDPLTGLPNRALIEDRLSHALDLQRRIGGCVGVLFVDVDRFKLANDGLGHAAGDELLIAVGQRLRDVVRTGDTVARTGGDEFVIVCEGLANAADAEVAATRIVDGFARPLTCGARELSVSVSVGISVSGAMGGESAETLIRDADTAMYRAKDAGRNQFAFFDEASRALSQDRLELEQDLREAPRTGELHFDYQAQFQTGTRKLIGAEALIRWDHPTRGLLQPAAFVPLAEESGLIESIGAWGVREACRQAAAWARRTDGLQIVVNVAVRQLLAPGFVELVADALDAASLAPTLLCLELTESSALVDLDQAIRRLDEVRALGVEVSLDDFGTGYSSLGHFSRLPISWVKVDRSFVGALHDDPTARAVVESVIRIAATRDIRVVAEGVETHEQLDLLTRLGCGYVQGFLLARPASAAAFEAEHLDLATH